MKRFNCTLADKRGEFGECMEAHNTGRYVLFSDVEKLQRRMQEMLDKSNRTGVAIERAISTGAVPADHPLKSRLDLLANHHKHEQALADGMVAMADQCHLLASLLRELRDGVEGDWCFPGDLDERIDSALAVTLCVRLDAACTEATTTPTEQDYRELQEQHDQLQSTHKGTLVLLQEAHEVMRRIIPPLPQDCANRSDLLDRIEVALSGHVPAPAPAVQEGWKLVQESHSKGASRGRFEEWFKRDYHPDKQGPYIKDIAWVVWQAALSAAPKPEGKP